MRVKICISGESEARIAFKKECFRAGDGTDPYFQHHIDRPYIFRGTGL